MVPMKQSPPVLERKIPPSCSGPVLFRSPCLLCQYYYGRWILTLQTEIFHQFSSLPAELRNLIVSFVVGPGIAKQIPTDSQDAVSVPDGDEHSEEDEDAGEDEDPKENAFVSARNNRLNLRLASKAAHEMVDGILPIQTTVVFAKDKETKVSSWTYTTHPRRTHSRRSGQTAVDGPFPRVTILMPDTYAKNIRYLLAAGKTAKFPASFMKALPKKMDRCTVGIRETVSSGMQRGHPYLRQQLYKAITADVLVLTEAESSALTNAFIYHRKQLSITAADKIKNFRGETLDALPVESDTHFFMGHSISLTGLTGMARLVSDALILKRRQKLSNTVTVVDHAKYITIRSDSSHHEIIWKRRLRRS